MVRPSPNGGNCDTAGRYGRGMADWEPVSGFEPLTCRLREAREHAAEMPQRIALEVLNPHEFCGHSFYGVCMQVAG